MLSFASGYPYRPALGGGTIFFDFKSRGPQAVGCNGDHSATNGKVFLLPLRFLASCVHVEAWGIFVGRGISWHENWQRLISSLPSSSYGFLLSTRSNAVDCHISNTSNDEGQAVCARRLPVLQQAARSCGAL